MEENNKRFIKATWQIMEKLLNEDDLTEALSGSLEIILKVLNSEAGALWFLDGKKERLLPIYHVGPCDVSGFSIENGTGIEGTVVQTGKSIRIENAESDPRFDGTLFDDLGLRVKTMLCVPLTASGETHGCIQIINKQDGSSYDEEELRLAERMASLAAMTIEEKGLLPVADADREVLISLRNVIKEFNNAGTVSRVLKGINLDVYKGEFLVVLGESGCGKSTMMNIIGGMDYLTDGQLLVEGRDYSRPTDKELTEYRRHYIGFIFQSYNLMPNLSALENVRFIAEISGDPMPPKEALERVGLAEKGGSYPAQMSGGQQQRVSIARAIVKNPKLILADEPTAALDYETSIEVLQTIEEIVREKQTTVIMLTPNPAIGKMADRVVKLRSGRVFSIRTNAHPLKAAELEW